MAPDPQPPSAIVSPDATSNQGAKPEPPRWPESLAGFSAFGHNRISRYRTLGSRACSTCRHLRGWRPFSRFHSATPWHCVNGCPLPQGQGSFVRGDRVAGRGKKLWIGRGTISGPLKS